MQAIATPLNDYYPDGLDILSPNLETGTKLLNTVKALREKIGMNLEQLKSFVDLLKNKTGLNSINSQIHNLISEARLCGFSLESTDLDKLAYSQHDKLQQCLGICETLLEAVDGNIPFNDFIEIVENLC